MTVYWITGLSGVGKTTVANALVQTLRQRGEATVLLDGDAVRAAIADPNVAYDVDSRRVAARRMCRLVAMFAEQGLQVVVATISLFHEIHAWNRQHLPDYLEIWLIGREGKQLNKQGIAEHQNGPVVGVDIPPEFPRDHHLSIENSGDSADLPLIVDQILQTALQHGVYVR
jgi:adenylylsulfate kinase